MESPPLANTNLLNRLVQAGLVYTHPLDSNFEKGEIDRSLLWGQFGGLFFFLALPGEPLCICIVTREYPGVCRNRDDRVLHYRYSVLSASQVGYLERAVGVVVGAHVMVQSDYRVSAFPYLKEEVLWGREHPMMFILHQQCKPPMSTPSFKQCFLPNNKRRAIFDLPGDSVTQDSSGVWGRVVVTTPERFPCPKGLGVVFGTLGDKTSLDVQPVRLQEGVVCCSQPNNPWVVNSYVNDVGVGECTIEYQLVPCVVRPKGVVVLCFSNTLYGVSVSLRIEYATFNLDGTSSVSYGTNEVEVPSRCLRMFAAVETDELGKHVFRNQSSGTLSID